MVTSLVPLHSVLKAASHSWTTHAVGRRVAHALDHCVLCSGASTASPDMSRNMESEGTWVFGYLVLEASRNCRSVSIDNVLLQELVKLLELSAALLVAAVQLPCNLWRCPVLHQCKGRNGILNVLFSLSGAPFATLLQFCLPQHFQRCLLKL